MTGMAKRGISSAIAIAARVVCLVVAAAVVMVPSVALAHWHADPPVSIRAVVGHVSDEVAWDAARGSEVALANLYSQRHPTSIGRTIEMSPARHSDECSSRGIDVPAHAAPDALAGISVPAVQDCLADVQTCSGQGAVAGREQGMATYPEHARTKDAFARPVRVGSADPAQRVAMSQMSVRYADRHAVAAPGEVADCREAVAATRRGWTMDAPGQTLSVERAILSQAQPTSLLAQADSRALDAGRLHDPATRIMAAACVGEANSATAANPDLGKADTRFGRFHSRGLCTYRVTV
jgi:hypothetical protein